MFQALLIQKFIEILSSKQIRYPWPHLRTKEDIALQIVVAKNTLGQFHHFGHLPWKNAQKMSHRDPANQQ
jgi:hypothetical protein